MSNTFYIVSETVLIILKFVVAWMYNDPTFFLTVLLASILVVTSVSKVRKVVVPVLFSSQAVYLMLFILMGGAYQLWAISRDNSELTSALTAAKHQIKMSKFHRLELIEKISKKLSDDITEPKSDLDDANDTNPLDGCLHVFIDLGTNRGIQIRKLYEPHLFPLAPILPLYNKYFGEPEDRIYSEICSVGFEPNAKHEDHLQAISEAYASCGIKVLMKTKTGVGASNKMAKLAVVNGSWGGDIPHDTGSRFVRDDFESEDMKDIQGHLTVHEFQNVSMVRLSDFLLGTVATRRLPMKAQVETPRVVVKMDIEGAEVSVVPDLLLSGAFSVVDNLHGEWHGCGCHGAEDICKTVEKLEETSHLLSQLSKELPHQFEVTTIEDETYGGYIFPEVKESVPTC